MIMRNKSPLQLPRSNSPQMDKLALLNESRSKGRTKPDSSASALSKGLKFAAMRNKARLHLALYARPNYPDTYHYALLVRPKDIAATIALSAELTANKYHVKNTLRINADGIVSQPWIYETTYIPDLAGEPRLLATLVIGKVLVPIEDVGHITQNVPVYQVDDPSGRGEKFNCVEWVRLAIEELRWKDAISDNGLAWEIIHEELLNFMRRKKRDRRWEVGWKGGVPEAVATFDLLTGKDLVF